MRQLRGLGTLAGLAMVLVCSLSEAAESRKPLVVKDDTKNPEDMSPRGSKCATLGLNDLRSDKEDQLRG